MIVDTPLIVGYAVRTWWAVSKEREGSLMRVCLLALVAVVGSASNVMADPVTVSFSRIANSQNQPQNPAAQLTAIMSDAGAGQIKFRFENDVTNGIAASICDVYFADGTLLGIASISASAGVSFSQGAAPGNLPGGNSLNPVFQTTAGFSADSNPPVAPNGVNSSAEWLEITFNLINGKTFSDSVNALHTGELRLGMHVQAIGNGGGSDSFYNTGLTMVPLPGTAAMGFACLGGLAAARRRRNA